ncbi:MAG: 5'-nucleotidase C-terminal domain-containing protein, partial [Coriobacteriales bacterium]|nr:5'-nucleotidase C-terminal domain-containing protein [Coriobacteriales bacterium]
LLPVDERLTKNAKVEAALQEFRDVINEKYLSRFDCSFDEVLAEAPFGFTPIDTFGNEQGEEPLGNLISDAFIAAVKEAEGVNYRNVDVAIVPYGTIRASLAKGPVTVADAYNVSSLGIGPDKVPGYPLVSLYLTGAELKTAAEVDISISTLMIDARLYMSGLTYTYNPNRLILNRVTSVQLVSPEGRISDLDDAKLYRVVGGLYSCQMLGEVEAQSYGLLSITPKDVSGKPIGNFEQHIIYSDEVELKEWVALANYLASFDAVDGTPRIPEYYSQLHDRKVLDDSNSLVDILKNPNKIAFIVLGVIVVVLAILIVPTVLIIRRVRRRSKRARLAKAQEQQE